MTQPSPPFPPSTGSAKPERATLSRELGEFLIEFSIGINKFSMYPEGHPSLAPAAEGLGRRLDTLLRDRSSLSIGVARSQLVIEGVATDPSNPVLKELASRLHRHQLGAITFVRGATPGEIESFLKIVAVDADRSEPLGLVIKTRGASWPNIRVFAMLYDRLELVDEEPDAEHQDRAARTRAAQLWIGMARAAMAADDAEGAPTEEQKTGGDEGPGHEPTAVARAIDQHPRGTAYDQVIVGYMLQIAEELRSAAGTEAAALRKRMSKMIAALQPQTLQRLMDMGGDGIQRRQFLLDASQGMAVDAVMDLVHAASDTGGQTVSHSMLRMLQKLAHHAESGRGGRRVIAEASVREQVADLIRDWSLKDPNPDAYRIALESLSVSRPLFQVATEALYAPEPQRLVEMALEIDVVGEPVQRAIDELMEQGKEKWLVDVLEKSEAPQTAQALWRRFATRDRIGECCLPSHLISLCWTACSLASEWRPLNRCWTRWETPRPARPAACCWTDWSSWVPSIAPMVVERLADDRWFVLRNLLWILNELDLIPEGFKPADYSQHADARVRREALRLMFRDPSIRERAICRALADSDERTVRLALSSILDACPAAAVPLVVARATSGTSEDQRLAAIRVLGVASHDLAVTSAAHTDHQAEIADRHQGTAQVPGVSCGLDRAASVRQRSSRPHCAGGRGQVSRSGCGAGCRLQGRPEAGGLMATSVDFLTAFAQSLSALALYPDGHRSRERALDSVYQKLQDLLASGEDSLFSFLGDEVICGTQPLKELRGWEWSRRLSDVGVQRLQFDATVSREELEEFLDQVLARLNLKVADTTEARQMRPSGIRFGAIGIRGEQDAPADEIATANLAFTLHEEADTMRWLHQELANGGGLPLAEAETVVRALSVAMHGEAQMVLPLLKLRQFDEYTTTHSINVSVLTMGLAEWLGMGAQDVRAFGVAGLLHDLGKVKIPKDILNKAGKLAPEERAVMNSHPVEGARLIIATEHDLDLAAVVAYEHHIMLNGGGYPTMRYTRDCHYASKLVHVCDVYDALRTNRPYRAAWPSEQVLAYLEERSGSEFDGTVAHSFAHMMREREARVSSLAEDEAVPTG